MNDRDRKLTFGEWVIGISTLVSLVACGYAVWISFQSAALLDAARKLP
jgi:hypothetical protein